MSFVAGINFTQQEKKRARGTGRGPLLSSCRGKGKREKKKDVFSGPPRAMKGKKGGEGRTARERKKNPRADHHRHYHFGQKSPFSKGKISLKGPRAAPLLFYNRGKGGGTGFLHSNPKEGRKGLTL